MADEHWNRLVPALMLLSREHPELASIDSEMKEQQHDITEAILRAGVDEGVLAPAVLDDVGRTIALLAGPILLAGLTGMAVLDNDFAADCVVQFLAGNAPRPAGAMEGA